MKFWILSSLLCSATLTTTFAQSALSSSHASDDSTFATCYLPMDASKLQLDETTGLTLAKSPCIRGYRIYLGPFSNRGTLVLRMTSLLSDAASEEQYSLPVIVSPKMISGSSLFSAQATTQILYRVDQDGNEQSLSLTVDLELNDEGTVSSLPNISADYLKTAHNEDPVHIRPVILKQSHIAYYIND